MFEKVLFLVIFFAIMVTVGIYSRKHATNVNDFVLGGRSVGPWLTAFAFGTSYFSSVVFVGYAGQFGWKYGMAATWIGLGNAFIGSLLPWVVLGRRTRVMTNSLQAATMPEFFEKRYNSKALKLVASAIVFIFLVPYTASIYNGLSNLFGMAFDIDYRICVIGMALLTGVYVILGGYMATAINDFIQGIIMLIGICAVIYCVLAKEGGFIAALTELATNPTMTGAAYDSDVPGVYASFFGPDPVNLVGVVILTSLGTWGLPQMVQKFYAIKDEKSIKTGTVISTVFALIVAGGSYFLGGFARMFNDSSFVKADGSVAFDGIIPFVLSTLPDILIGVVVVLVLSASMSTLSSLVLTSSSTLTLDFLKGTIVKDMSEKKQLFIMRVLIAFFIIISVILALDPPTFIAQLMGISWGALAGAFLAPFMYGLYWKGVTKSAVWASFAVGVGITVGNLFFHFFASPINAGAAAMIASLVVVPIVSLMTPKMKKEKVDEIFSCYDEKIEVKKKTSLGHNA
ncbi:MAG: sodium:solute symporter [Lachnospiraceae bacterium]|nr:sodium:solute symporter [Lachnospiraceae bacterium]